MVNLAHSLVNRVEVRGPSLRMEICVIKYDTNCRERLLQRTSVVTTRRQRGKEALNSSRDKNAGHVRTVEGRREKKAPTMVLWI